MSEAPPPAPTSPSPSTSETLVEENQQEFAELLTFIDFAEGLTIGFVEINQEQDRILLAEALRQHLADTEIHIEVMNFSRQPDLRYLLDELRQRLAQLHASSPPKADQKLVLYLQGLETAIGTDGVGAYPPMLQDLNFVRDAYRDIVPHPLLFVLPDYALTRISQYAPDFWAWQSGLFRFKTSAQTVEQLRTEAFERPLPYIASTDNQEQIEQLKQLLMELNPTGKPIAPQDLAQCCELYYKIGSAYYTQKQPAKARDYLLAGLDLLKRHPNPTLEQDLYRRLGNAYEDLRQFDTAIAAYTTALDLARATKRSSMESTLLHDLGDIALQQRQFDQAKAYYEQSLALKEARNDRYSQAVTHHNLGIVAQELREYEQARSHYQQALDIYIEYGDRYGQADIYHQLGIVAQELREYEQARSHYQQALDIKIEFGDRYSQASTYGQLGNLTKSLREYQQAGEHFQKALEIHIEFNDRYNQALDHHNLGMVAEKLQEYEQARSYYQQSLDIKIEYGDRYSQARTYSQLGLLAEELNELDQAKAHHLQDLQISVEFNDQHRIAFVLRNLARLYQTTQDDSLLTTVAQCLNITPDEVQQRFTAASA
ncbi:tetratricopeptide repeat protein [Leptolyngbya sp. CCY15150]|uniref:tetratricopeptide repeat protein n=1 Tax=Leptolyngbya sp. CCY15150 TaxID=2767772 RepID=UPI00195257DC|nr:tetratricopeptide repeat protein [Leptolyngbya sp. CCY15150]